MAHEKSIRIQLKGERRERVEWFIYKCVLAVWAMLVLAQIAVWISQIFGWLASAV